ncbi:uncharacterized protein EI90DRAFT_1564346 [Cantharellus anzutake]|uniref:uncharacterized protein n=1 Tax=Cantharellus anzutake TaxID=1750568 RepID=UPI00190789AD|nr:uncharacterized protein EI90DRAFT_1564346 [Cantharellus anzutake]KAF8328335.1 hypothetical protein EI90DRAFT_1564346 [Cantharellus anzutake]
MSITPDNAFAWLDSHRKRNFLQNVSLNKISKLLEKVHAIAEEEGFRLRAHCDRDDDQLSLTTSQARGQGAESIITHTPTQRGANINVPSEQFASSLPPRQTPSQPSLGYTTAATYPFPLPNMLPPGVIDGATMPFMPRHSASTDGMHCRFDTYPSALGPNNYLMPVMDLPLQTMDMGDESLQR